VLRDEGVPGRPPAGGILPPFPIPSGEDLQGLAGGQRALVREVRIEGNTALTDADLAKVEAPYLGRELSLAEILALADAVTQAYVDRGYVTSGATVPEQSLADHVLTLQVVEGVLERVEVETDGRFRPQYFASRLMREEGPINVHDLEARLQIFQQDPRIAAIQAQLLPSERRGESLLRVRVREASPWWAEVEGNNYQAPAIGEFRGITNASYANLTGFGDEARLGYTGGEGIQKLEGGYQIPFTRWDTRFDVDGTFTWSKLVEDDVEDLDIKSRFGTVGIGITQPISRSVEISLEGFLRAEWRYSKSFLLGQGFSFVAGPDEGVAKVAVLRQGLDFAYRTRSQVFAARSMLSVGIDVLGATHHGDSQVPDGRFVAWLAQLQWARRLPWLGAEVLARFDVQLSNHPLLGMEQFAVGGHESVRGYLENYLVRDQGLAGSFEIRVPVLSRPAGPPWLEAGPFIDAGYSWNASRDGPNTFGPTTLVGTGIAARAWLTEWIRLDVEWGRQLRNVPDVGDWSLQENGVFLGLSVDLSRWGR
jgi:hemolysin activation/secretion protein